MFPDRFQAWTYMLSKILEREQTFWDAILNQAVYSRSPF